MGRAVMNIPQILLNVLPHDLPLLPDEIRHIQQPILFLLLAAMALNNRTRHNADPAFFSQLLVLLEIRLPLIAQAGERRVFRKPVGKMVFWQND
jgi:hypothetical protein